MANALLGQIAAGITPNVLGQIREQQSFDMQKQLFEQQQQQQQQQAAQQAEVQRLSGEILGATMGGKIAGDSFQKLIQADPQGAMKLAEGLGIPLDQPGRMNNLVGTAKIAENIARTVGPREALQFVENEREKLRAFGIQTPIVDEFIGQLQQDPVEAVAGLSEFVTMAEETGLLRKPPTRKEMAETDKIKAETEKIKSETLARADNEQTKIELQKAQADLQLKQDKIQQNKVKAQEAVEQKDRKAVADAFDTANALEAVNTLLVDDAFENIYGFGANIIPTIMPESVALEAMRDQLGGLLSLESREKLKGQGTITDAEFNVLKQSATILQNPGISEARAKKELNRIKSIFENKLKKTLKNPEAKSALIESGMLTTGKQQLDQTRNSTVRDTRRGRIIQDAQGNRLQELNGEWVPI